MGAASFLFGFLAVGIIGATSLASHFETVQAERLGARAFLFLLCLLASAISALSYAESFRRLRRRPRWFTGLLGGVAAAGTFCASVSAFYTKLWDGLGLGFGYLVALTLVLPTLIALLWPFLTVKAPSHDNPN